MKLIPTIAFVAIAALAGLSRPALGQDDAAAPAAASPAPPMKRHELTVPELRQAANKAYADKNYPDFLEAVSALHQMRPWNGEYMSLLVLAYALNENRPKAYEQMLAMQRQGLSYDFNASPDTAYLRGTEAFDYINDLMLRAGEPAGEAEVQFQLPPDLLLVTAIDWDPTREAFLVSNARDGAVFQVDRKGDTRELLHADADNGLLGIFGLLVDTDRNRLWVTSAPSANFKGYEGAEAGPSALFEFELDSLKLLHRYPVPDDGRPHRLGDLTLAAGGDVFIVDKVLPIVYRLHQGEDHLNPFVASPDNVSLRGITASDDGNKLYVADYEMGIMVLDLQNRQALRLSGPETLNFGGIDGLFYWNGYLIMIQNGNDPERIMRLQLSADGNSVENVAPLAIAQPWFDHPDHGTVVGDDLVFFANSHWVRKSSGPEPIRVASTSIANAPDLTSPDVEKFWDEYYKKTGQKPPEADAGQQ